MTKAERQRLLERALQERERRRVANQKARETRRAGGRRRIEKTVPSTFVAEIRRIVAEAVAEMLAGRDPGLRRVATRGVSAQETQAEVTSAEVDLPPAPAAPPPGARGLGWPERRRAQAARRRERQSLAGLQRTTFDIPAAMAPRVSKLVDQLVRWMSEGFEVVLETEASPQDAPQARPSTLGGSAVAQALDECLAVGDDQRDEDSSPLFDDIQGFARLERRGSGAGNPKE